MDDADRAQQDIEQQEKARNSRFDTPDPYQPPAGTPGDCDLCGEWCGRLVGGACVPCREKYKLP